MLKQTNDGLSKVWKVHKSSNPFYAGGKVEVLESRIGSGSRIACLFEGNVSLIEQVDGENGETRAWSLLSQEDAETNPVVCFCCHPTKEEIVVATQKSVIYHYSFSEGAEGAEGLGAGAGEARSSSSASSSSGGSGGSGSGGDAPTPTPSASLIRTIRAGNMPILCMALDPSATLIATGSSDRSVKVWDLAGGFCTHSFKEHTDIVRSVQFYTPGQGLKTDSAALKIISCGDDKVIRVFDLAKSKPEAALREHVSQPTAVAVSADGVLMASCGRDKVRTIYSY
jgi:WD40 repeat protein